MRVHEKLLGHLRTIAAIALLLIAPVSTRAVANPIDEYDPLHGYCINDANDCQDNGTVTAITTTNTPTFGFTKSPDYGSGTFFLDVLIPNSVANAGSQSIIVSGTNTGNVTVTGVQMGNWTGGDLTKFLGRSTTPNNPLDGWLPTTQHFQKSATGYYVYDFNFGKVNFGTGKEPTFSSPFAYPAGTIITAFLCAGMSRGKCTSWVSTAQSAALAIEYQAKRIPEPASLALFLTGLFGIGALCFRRLSGRLNSAIFSVGLPVSPKASPRQTSCPAWDSA